MNTENSHMNTILKELENHKSKIDELEKAIENNNIACGHTEVEQMKFTSDNVLKLKVQLSIIEDQLGKNIRELEKKDSFQDCILKSLIFRLEKLEALQKVESEFEEVPSKMIDVDRNMFVDLLQQLECMQQNHYNLHTNIKYMQEVCRSALANGEL